MTLPLSKTMHKDDLQELAMEVALVDAVGVRGQTPEARRWEYAMALRALRNQSRPPIVAYDVGGSGSTFSEMFRVEVGWQLTEVIDPAAEGGHDLQTFLGGNPRLADCVFCLSVLEHVEDLDQFLYHLSCLTAPGGLLFLTMDCWNQIDVPDTAHFHWMRKRIFEVPGWIDLMQPLRDFELLGNYDLRYHDHQLYGSYSVASLALRKRS